jgi:carbon storage regulator
MLVLTRKEQETIRIGEEITIQVLEVRAGKVRIGIVAPRGCLVLRGEIVHSGRIDRVPCRG